MKIIKDLDTKFTNKTVITIGTFDGVHLGHKKILEKVVSSAKEKNLESTLVTFFPHPRIILQNDASIKLLNSIEEKQKLIENCGIENLIIHPFTKEFSLLSAEDFVKTILIDKLNISKIIIGYDHRFGKNRTADINDLIEFGSKYNFDVEQIDAKLINETTISSTKIRKALDDGNISIANNFLGYKYLLCGKVVKGNQIGRTIGFPTANLHINEDYKLIPKNGVYFVKSTIDNANFYGLLNIGNRPTVDGKNQTIEVHFLDFSEDIYNTIITIELIDFIRDEEKFDSLEALKNQIKKDKDIALTKINSLL